MADLQISVDIDATGTRRGASEARSEVQNLAREAERAGRGMRNALNGIDFRAIGQRIAEIGQRMQAAGAQMQSFGTTLTAAITLPLTALGTLGVKAALEVDAVRTKITALVGDSEKANRKIAELRELASRSVGVTQAAALETFAQLKGIGDIADESINRVIGSLGKLNAAFKIEDQAGFLRNLVQLFSQGFQIPDLKEAIGRVPIFTQLLEQAFGTKDPEKLRQLQEAGKLTLDSFLTGLSDAINTDPRTANITENLTTKIAKSFERLNVALAPIGDVILNAIVPVIERLSPFLERLGQQFAALSPTMQQVVVAGLALAAAIGPVLVIAGSLIGAIGTIVSALGALIGSATTVGIAVGALIGLIVQIGPILAIAAAQAYVLYQAWQTNFGGIRDLTAQVAAFVTETWNAAAAALTELTADLTARIKQFWEQNGEDIMRALQTVSDFIRSIWTEIVAFWEENGETIKTITQAVWEILKTIVKNGLEIILQTIRLVTAIINGDWAKAWDAIKQIVASTLVAIGTVIANSQAAIVAAVRGLIDVIIALGAYVHQVGIDIGVALIQGIISGIGRMAGPLGTIAANVINGAISRMREAANIQSPSKETEELGMFMAEGLQNGLLKGAEAVNVASRSLAEGSIDGIRTIVSQGFDILTDSGLSFGQKIKRIFSNVVSEWKRMLSNMVREWLSSGLFGGGSGSRQGGGILGGLLNGIFGGGATGIGPGGTPTFNLSGTTGLSTGGGPMGGSGLGGALGSRGLGALSGGSGGSGGFDSRTGTYSNAGGRGFSSIFGGGLQGTLTGIGSIGTVLGGAIGGRAGGFLSNIGSGVALGAQIGSIIPGIGTAIGAVVGGAIGFFSSLFGGDPKRKRDKREKLPELNRGFTDAMQQLRDLIRDVRTLRVDPDSAISRAQELRTQIASGFGIQFESKKYRKQAQTLIRQRTAEADTLIEELRRVAEVSRAAGERQRRIIPEFASGVYISPAFMRQLADYRRQINGMIPGRFRGQDNVPAMLSPGEMVLNPAQQERTRRAAGFDVFRSAGIPGYSGGEQRGQAGQMPAMTFVFEHSVDAEGMVKTTLKNSPAVQNQLQLTIEDLSANDRLTQRRRGV